jgi:TrmH family RNA methyltransferase
MLVARCAGIAKYIRPLSTVPDWRAVRALQQKKQRQEQGLFLVQGPKVVAELLASGWPVHSIHAHASLADRYPKHLVHAHPPHDLVRMGTQESGNEVIAVVPMPTPPAYAVLRTEEMVLALDGIADPGNLGTLLRIADWFGITRVLLSSDSVEEFNPKCVQASMGSLFRVAVRRASLPDELDRLRSDGAKLYLATMEGKSIFELKVEQPAVLILGSESHGPSEEVRALGAVAVSVPRFGNAESLNVAAAASALCMELARQARTP